MDGAPILLAIALGAHRIRSRMRGRTRTSRLQEIQDALLSANTGYLLVSADIRPGDGPADCRDRRFLCCYGTTGRRDQDATPQPALSAGYEGCAYR